MGRIKGLEVMTAETKIDLSIVLSVLGVLIACLATPYYSEQNFSASGTALSSKVVFYGWQSQFQWINLSVCALAAVFGLMRTKDRSVPKAFLILTSVFYVVFLFFYQLFKSCFLCEGYMRTHFYASYEVVVCSGLLLFLWAYTRTWGR
jgi:hypothetical protein